MTQLVDLIISNRHNRQALLDLLHICLGRRNGRNPGTCKDNFGCGTEFKHQIRIPRFLTKGQYLRQGVLSVLIEMVHHISVIPINTEILCRRLQIGKPSYRLLRIGIALGVGILRHAPDSLDALIFRNQSFHHIHIRPLRGHRHIYHLNSKILCNRKMSVISGYRT